MRQILIHGAFDHTQQFGRPLHLVERDAIEPAQETGWIRARRGEDRLVIQRQVLAMAADQLANERGLAALGPLSSTTGVSRRAWCRRVSTRRG